MVCMCNAHINYKFYVKAKSTNIIKTIIIISEPLETLSNYYNIHTYSHLTWGKYVLWKFYYITIIIKKLWYMIKIIEINIKTYYKFLKIFDNIILVEAYFKFLETKIIECYLNYTTLTNIKINRILVRV